MKSHDTFREELQKIAAENSTQKLFDYIEENAVVFFSTPFMSDYYRIIKDKDMSASEKMLPILVKAWLAFLCGDNAALNSIMRHIDELRLTGPHESSFYYALKAIMGDSPDPQQLLKYAKLSVDVLPEGDNSLFMANARLTYAQILAGLDQYRSAIESFDVSYRMFHALGAHFPAVVALVNKLLNSYKLGEFITVMDECNRMLNMSASFREEVQDYWNVVHLPLGMCYFELNKPSLAIQHLKQAKACIDKMNLFHMHGLIELYIFKAYYVLDDKAGMEEIKTQATADFKHMHYTMTDLLLCMFRTMSSESDCSKGLQADIERLEMEFIRSREKSPLILIEALAYLKIKGLSDAITAEDIVKSLEALRFIGTIPYIQLFLVLLAELHYMEGRQKNAVEALKEAASIYKEYGASAGFFALPLKSVHLLEKLDYKLYSQIVKKSRADKPAQQGPALSAREREIMQLVAQGKGNEEISKLLFISVGTTKWHINHIFAKLEVENRMQAAEKAKRLGEIL